MRSELWQSMQAPVLMQGVWNPLCRAAFLGAAMFRDPYAPLKIIDGLQAFMEQNGISSVSELTGGVQLW